MAVAPGVGAPEILEPSEMTVPSPFSPVLLADRVAVVTGGATGIGLAVACALTEAGASVVIASRSAERLAAAEVEIARRTGRPAWSLPCDVREEDEVARLRDFVRARCGSAAIVVNNAAANFRLPAERMTSRAMRAVLETDLLGTYHVTRAFFDDLKAIGHGSVLSIGIAAAEQGFPGFSHAGAAKTAISSLTASWASEWGPYGIRANCIAPGPIPTKGVWENMLGHPSSSEADAGTQAFANLVPAVPLRRLGTPEDVAAAAVFLSSDLAGWITGVTLRMDGGLNLTQCL
ncbi:SDR family oxidoreductase [Kitasatospora aureofaciens]|uniref:SDR family oxidoreductase n=1 Tax=Kitasatospora aureofaciens TaxID=1894 RepID=UPI001D3AAEF4|nr:SDR family oxidoreductase [Kitasatospora aureofaciens]HJD81134.1 SDR family oxidoreductase [Kitasatospora aureofaciens]